MTSIAVRLNAPALAPSRPLLGLVLVSALAGFTRWGPLHGTPVALVGAVILHVYLPGYLLARALGRHRAPHPISRYAWVLASAFAVTVTLGAAARLLHAPPLLYLLALHLLMLVLALVRPPDPDPEEHPWGWSWSSLPLYLLVGLCVAIVLGVGLERNQYRISYYEDQTVFIELADWLANDPIDPSRRSRRIGVEVGDTRWDTDGWTYNHAVWVWESGVPAADLIWFGLTPLFVWTTPLVIFALAYELTGRQSAAAWSVAALTLVGLMTLDGVVYYPTTLAFGQFSLFQVNTLRTVATALVTPLALLAGMAYVRRARPRDLLLTLLLTFVVATMHPRQVIIVFYSVGATMALAFLARPSRRRLWQGLALAVILAVVLALPLIQRAARPFLDSATSQMVATALDSGDGSASGGVNARVELRQLTVLPLLGNTFIVEPTFIFYHPVIYLVVAIGLLAVVAVRRSLAAQYLFTATAVTLILLFVPGIAAIFVRYVTPTVAPGIFFALPVALALGLGLDSLLRLLAPAVRARHVLSALVGLALAASLLLLVFEPFPLPATARDQIRAANTIQSLRRMHPADVELIETLRDLLPARERNVLITPERVANFVVESVPHTQVTGGRASGNVTWRPTRRFLSETGTIRPWLDDEDIRLINDWGITHIVLEANDTRLPQLLLQPERFEWLASPAGYVVFAVRGVLPEYPQDNLFGRMNDLYARQQNRRWHPTGFDLNLPGNPDGWNEIVAAWLAHRDDDVTRLALAFSHLLSGDDRRALPFWQQLRAAHPESALLAEALALTHVVLGDAPSGADVLLDALDAPDAGARVLAARRLLTPEFFYLLDDETLDRVIATTEADAVAWDHLVNLERPDEVRERVVLLVAAGRLATALDWQSALPTAEIDPRDLLTRASLQLALGDVDAALATLAPTLDPEWFNANRHLHPDRWETNVALQTYHLLRAEFARRAGQMADARAAFDAAIDAGSQVAAPALYAAMLEAGAQPSAAADLRAQAEAAWSAASDQPLPDLRPLLDLAGTGQLYALDPVVEVDETGGLVAVTATFGNPHLAPLPVRAWTVRLISPDAREVYASAELPATFVPGALARATVTLPLPDDLPPLTSALVFVEPRYDNRVTFEPLVQPVTLNRPESATPPAGAVSLNARFGDAISLVSYVVEESPETLTLRLYWRADARPDADYQVFVHLLDAAGQPVRQVDTTPVAGRYPTSHWKTDTLIEDSVVIALEPPLPPGTYQVVAGMYRLPDVTRLPVTVNGERLPDDAIPLHTLVVE